MAMFFDGVSSEPFVENINLFDSYLIGKIPRPSSENENCPEIDGGVFLLLQVNVFRSLDPNPKDQKLSDAQA